jgi:hypothetical protein
MAMRPCRECGKAISTEAQACPHCGDKPRRTSAFTWIIAVFFGLVGFSWFSLSLRSDTRPAPPPPTPAQLAQEKREREQSALAYLCKELVKKSLHDPATAQFEDGFAFGRRDGVDRIQVKVRARNAYNAVRLATFECRVGRTGGKPRLTSVEQLP